MIISIKETPPHYGLSFLFLSLI